MSRSPADQSSRADPPGRYPPGLGGRGRILLTLFFAAGIAFLGLLGGGEHRLADAGLDPMAGFYGVEMPRYPGGVERPLTQRLEVGAADMRIAYFATDDSPAKVADFYAADFRARGLRVDEDITPQGGAVSAYDPRLDLVRQVMILPRDGRTFVFPSVSRQPARLLDTSGAVAAGTPVYPGAEGLLSFAARDPLGRSRATLYTDSASLADNLKFLRAAMAGRGFRQEPVATTAPQVGPQHHLLVFRRAGAETTIGVSDIGGGQVRVHITEVTP